MKKYLEILIIVVMATVQYSCKKQLDALPKDALVEGNAIINQQTANIALNGVYYLFANATATNTNWLTNEVNGGILAGYLDNGNNTINEAKNVLGTTTMNSEWKRDYTLANSANGVIEGVSKLSNAAFIPNRRQQILAEAKFMRAYAHFKSLLWFGQWWDINSNYGVILRSTFISSTNIPQARANVKDSYALF